MSRRTVRLLFVASTILPGPQVLVYIALWVLIGAVMALYFGVLQRMEVVKVVTILIFSVIGIAGSYGVAWFGIRVNTFANSRTAFASLGGKPYP